jgi:hypothetical protein
MPQNRNPLRNEGENMHLINAQRRPGVGLAIATMIIGSIVLAGCASLSSRPVTPISTITEAAANGASSDAIIAGIRNAKTTYALRGSDFAKLDERGVPGPVLDELQQRFFGDVQLFTERWYMGRSAGGPTSIYPQPVDLDSLDTGGNGMAPTTDVGRMTHGTRPPGVPTWVPPYPAVAGEPITTDDVLAMSKSGQSAEEIVEKIRKSRVAVLYTDSPDAISLRRTAAITGSVYADLAKQGVAHEVLDALQASYLASHVEFTRKSTSVGTGGGVQR